MHHFQVFNNKKQHAETSPSFPELTVTQMTSVPFLSDGPTPADHSLHVVAVFCQQGAVKRRSNRAAG